MTADRHDSGRSPLYLVGLAAGLLLALILAGCNQSGRPPAASTPSPAAAPAVSSADTPISGSYTVVAGDTVYGIANRFGVPIRSLIDVNGLVPPYRLVPGQILQVPDQRVHIVAQDETVYGISRLYGVDSSTLVKLNAIDPPYTVFPGQTLVLPAPIEPVSMASSQATAPSSAAVTNAPLDDAGTSSATNDAPPPADAPTATVSAPTPTGSTQGMEAPPVVLPGGTATGGTPAPLPPKPDPAAGATGEGAESPAAPAAADSGTAASTATQTAVVDPMLIEPAGRSAGQFLWPVNGKVVSEFGGKEDGLHNDGINIAAPLGTPVRAAENGVVVYAGNELRGFGNMLLVRHADGWVSAYAHNESLLVARGDTVTRGQTIARVGSTGNVPSPQLHFELRRGTDAVNPRDFLGDSGA
jgi:murein DD-endopeptidase MepM/ murein hydrolase activator NlpD